MFAWNMLSNWLYPLQTGDEDYVSVMPMSLEFGPMSSSEIEIEIFISSDNITEDAEQFIAQLESSDSAVRLSTSSANITIVDISGKYAIKLENVSMCMYASVMKLGLNSMAPYQPTVSAYFHEPWTFGLL